MKYDNFKVLDEYEFLEFFGTEPIEKSIDDGYWCYKISDSNNTTLNFSFNTFEKSVQTSIFINDRLLTTTSYEGNAKMFVRNDKLYCEFNDKLKKTVLTISIKENVEVNWSTIRLQ